jgi:hypothetical protein
VSDISKQCGKRITDNGNEKQNAALEETASRKSWHTKLSAKSKAKAKASEKRAGRPYPNLVDNMNAAKKQQSKRSKK